MTALVHLRSRDNPRLKQLAALASSLRERVEHGQTVLDGPHLLDCALNAGFPLLDVCVSDSGCHKPEIQSLLARLPATSTPICVPDTLFSHLSPVDTPVGILARIAFPVHDAQAGHETLIVLDSIQDPGNLGTILRTAAAAGVGLVWLTSGCAQAWSPKALRAGMGAHFCLRIVEKVDVLACLASYAGKIVATGLSAASRTLYDTDLRGPVAWLFGAEGRGISPTLLERADKVVRIPMTGMESLNVGAAAAVCLFEQRRQCET